MRGKARQRKRALKPIPTPRARAQVLGPLRQGLPLRTRLPKGLRRTDNRQRSQPLHIGGGSKSQTS